jgi:GNAT superfamily N-acetyltransferase
MSAITYRDARADEGATLAGIAAATFIETFGPLYKLKDLNAFIAGYTAEAYAAELAEPDIAVRLACVGDVPIGFCKVSRLKLPAPQPAPGAMELRQLYVYKPWQGEGVAQVLTDWAIATARARQAPELWLSVYTENPRARRFYARQGFVEVAPYHFMVGDQADADILCRLTL